MTTNSNPKVVLVTGGSSGIGQAAAIALKNKGCIVYEISRRECAQPGINHFTADVTQPDQINSTVKTVIDREGRIDLLVNCAGFGIAGAIEFTPVEQAKAQFDVNFFGMVNVTKAVLPFMREQGWGRIINISSVAADANLPFQAYYSASKAAIDSYTLALINEIKPFGISVCSIQPGDIKTGFTGARQAILDGDEIYNGKISRGLQIMIHDEENGMEAQKAGNYIAGIAFKKHVKPIYVIGFIYKIESFLIKILPARLRNNIVGRMYAK